MAAKKKTTKAVRKVSSQAMIVVKPAGLPASIDQELRAATPPDYIKTRPGKGGKTFTYVPGTYVIMKLNAAFRNAWEFTITDKGIEESEVWVLGKLTIKDFQTGNSISKEQFGSKERVKTKGGYASPLGDVLKSAATDALKKCANLLGVAMDVYSGHIEIQEESQASKKKDEPVVLTTAQKLEQAMAIIKVCKNPDMLDDWSRRIQENTEYSEEQKKKLTGLIAQQIEKIING